jgi:choline dehydrogenase-like flavoprotein
MSDEAKKYDVIIVGGGTAGLVAAARLSEQTEKKILVIEAGTDRRGDPLIDVPGMLMSTWGNETYDWGFWSEPQVRHHRR